MKYMLEWPNPFVDHDHHRLRSVAEILADVEGEPLTVTCRLWLKGDENRYLPMPLRYAAAHPCSASAIIAVLKGNN